MTDEPDIEASLADLEKSQKRYQRVFRRATLAALGALLLLAAVNVLMVVVGAIGPIRDPWFYRNLTAIGGLTLLGMMGHLGATRAYRALVERDAELLDSYRKRAALEKVLGEMRDEISPLMAAIDDARAKGVAVVIHPMDGPPESAKRSVH
jgi:hypothetical protein